RPPPAAPRRAGPRPPGGGSHVAWLSPVGLVSSKPPPRAADGPGRSRRRGEIREGAGSKLAPRPAEGQVLVPGPRLGTRAPAAPRGGTERPRRPPPSRRAGRGWGFPGPRWGPRFFPPPPPQQRRRLVPPGAQRLPEHTVFWDAGHGLGVAAAGPVPLAQPPV